VVVGIGVVAAVPLLLAGSTSLIRANTTTLFDIRNTFVLPASIWWPFTHTVLPGSANPGRHVIPDWIGLVARPVVLAVGIGLPLLLAPRIRANPRARVLPGLALVFLLRCMLDPADSSWYHVPFFLALVAADALDGRILASLVAAFLLQLLVSLQSSAAVLCAVYLGWTIPFAIYLFARAYGARLAPVRGSRALAA